RLGSLSLMASPARRLGACARRRNYPRQGTFTSAVEAVSILVREADCDALGIATASRLLEPERPGPVRPAGDGIEVRIQQLAVNHRVADARRIMDVVERILVHHDEVGELARLDRTEVVLEPMRPRGVYRRGPK